MDQLWHSPFTCQSWTSLCQLEQEERELIQKIKDEEREKATAELEGWKMRGIQAAAVDVPPPKPTHRGTVQSSLQAAHGCSVNSGGHNPVLYSSFS